MVVAVGVEVYGPFRAERFRSCLPRAALRLPWAVEWDPVGVSDPPAFKTRQNFRDVGLVVLVLGAGARCWC